MALLKSKNCNEPIFELVKTPKQQRDFEMTWEYFCDKYGWHNDPYAENGIRYNLIVQGEKKANQRKVIGTIEFIPYDPKNPNSTVDGPNRAKFSNLNEIKIYHDRIWEVDKLCIHEEYQRQGYFDIFMHIFYDHTVRYNPKYYISLIEKKLYRMLRIAFRLSVEQKGNSFVGPCTTLIPVIFDIENMQQDKKRVSELLQTFYTPNENMKQKRNSLKKIYSKKKYGAIFGCHLDKFTIKKALIWFFKRGTIKLLNK